MAPSTSRFDIDKFDGSNDFSLWRIKMEALLCSQGLEGALEQTTNATDTTTGKRSSGVVRRTRNDQEGNQQKGVQYSDSKFGRQISLRSLKVEDNGKDLE